MRPLVEISAVYAAAFALAVTGCGAREATPRMTQTTGGELRPAPPSTTAPSPSAVPSVSPRARLLSRPITIGVPTPPNGLESERSRPPDNSAAEPPPGAMVPGAAGSPLETTGATR